MASQPANHIKATVGRNVKVARDLRDLTQRELADLLDVDAFQVSRWERGVHRPSDETLFALAQVLDRDPAWFYTDHEPVADEPAGRAAA